MKLSKSVKPISFLKAHASELINNLYGTRDTLIITQNGEAKAVLQDIKAYEEMQDTLALLKIVAQSQQSVARGEVKPMKQVFDELRKEIEKDREKLRR